MNVVFLVCLGCPLRSPISDHLICQVTHLLHHVPGCVSPKVACSVSAWTRTSHVQKYCKPFDINRCKGLRDTRTRPRANKRCKLPVGHVAHDHFSLYLQVAHGRTQYGVHLKMAKKTRARQAGSRNITFFTCLCYGVLERIHVHSSLLTPHEVQLLW